MKYLVMECHEGYAVLMDEQSRFVNAANLHYEVGQTVTEPILLDKESKPEKGGRRIIMRAMKVAATAACLAVVTVAGFTFFGKDKSTTAPHSVVFVSAAAEIEMELDDTGSVVRLSSHSDRGNEIIEKYIESHGKTTDKTDTANALLETQLENGYISAGDTVDVLVPADEKDYKQYKSELENRTSDLDINVNIKKKEDTHPHHEPPTPPAVTDNKGPARETATLPTAPAIASAAPTPADKATAPAVEPPTVPEEPVPPVAPDEGAHPTEPAPHERHEHPTLPHEEGAATDKKAHGPAALPAPEAPVAPELTEAPTAPEAPVPPIAEEAPAEPHEELPTEADNIAMIDSQ